MVEGKVGRENGQMEVGVRRGVKCEARQADGRLFLKNEDREGLLILRN